MGATVAAAAEDFGGRRRRWKERKRQMEIRSKTERVHVQP